MSSTAKVVFVTGCSAGGIGPALCEEFANRGCIVYATARRLEAMKFTHPNVRMRVLDVRSDDGVKSTIADVINEAGRIDVVVSNAGTLSVGPVIDVPLENIKATYDTNVFAVVRLAREVIPHMAARKSGMIAVVGSVSGDQPLPWSGIYSSSKAAVHSLTEMLMLECRPLGIDVQLIIPAAVVSQLSNNHHSNSFVLPEGSLWQRWAPAIAARVYASQSKSSMTAEEFANKVVPQTLARSPPVYVREGGNIILFTLLRWLPRRFAQWLLWRRLGENKV